MAHKISVPVIYTLYKPLPMNVSATREYDGISYNTPITEQKDLARVIKFPNWLTVSS